MKHIRTTGVKYLLGFLLLAGVLFGGCGSGQTTGVLGAFDEEVLMLQNKLRNRHEQRIEGVKFVSGKLNERDVVVAWTGIGKVNAAMTTTLLLEHFRPRQVIFTGIAGGINPQLYPGDIVIAEKTAQHDLGTLKSDGMTSEGMPSPVGGRKNPVFFPADAKLLAIAEQAAKQIKLDEMKTSEGARMPRIIKGTVVTGDIFVASTAKCEELRKRLGADAVEMEGAAVAQVCYMQRAPCIVIRSLSDKADEKAVEDLDRFYKAAAKNSAALVEIMVGKLAEETTAKKNMFIAEPVWFHKHP